MVDRHRQVAALMVAAGTGPRLRATLEFAMAVTIIAILTAVAAASFERCIALARMTEAFSLTSTMRSDLVAYRAVHGQWPATAAELGNSMTEQQEHLGQFVAKVDLLPHGGFTALFNDDSGTLSGKRMIFHVAAAGSDGSSPVAWFCDRGLAPAADEGSYLGGETLPLGCR